MAEQQAPATSQATAVIKQPDPPLVRASRVANIVNLDSVRFTQFSAHSTATNDDLATQGLNHRALFTRPKAVVDGRAITISSTFVFSVSKPPSNDDEKTAEVLATIRATIELRYTTKDESDPVDDGDLVEFANVNVPFNSWGYWREFVQSALARLGFANAVTLPLFRVQTASLWMIDNEPKTD